MKYKPLLLAPLGLIPAGIPVADAADMPVKAQPVQPARFIPLWTGFYAGVNVGVLSARSELNAFLPSSAVPAENNYCWLGRTGDCTFNNSSTATGVLGGIQIGYNFQSANIVYGAEVDFGGSSAKKSFGGTNPNSGYSYAAETGIEAMGTARARLGYAFDNNVMVYATGGLAFAKVRDSFLHISPPGGGNATYSWTNTGWRAGWTAGGGLEYMFARNWSVKGEALYYDLGDKDHESISPSFGGISIGVNDRMTGIIARVGINYLFH